MYQAQLIIISDKISIDKLANEVEQILQGKVDQDKIKQIKYNIDRSKYTIKKNLQIAKYQTYQNNKHLYTTYQNIIKQLI